MTGPVLILGPHRSGTSAATRVVNLLGVPLLFPGTMFAPAADNTEGFWESATMTDLNDRLLAVAGGSAMCPPPPSVDWSDLDTSALEEDWSSARPADPPWLWKDPRTSLTLAFWRTVITPPALVIHLHRHPAEVAQSLAARQTMPTRLGVAIWERYTRQLLHSSAGLPYCRVHFDDLLDCANDIIWHLRDRLIDVGVLDTKSSAARAIQSIQPILRHQRSTPASHKRLSPEQADLVVRIQALEKDQDSLSAVHLGLETPDLQDLFDATRPWEREANHLARTVEALQGERQRLTAQSDAYLDELNRLRSRSNALAPPGSWRRRLVDRLISSGQG